MTWHRRPDRVAIVDAYRFPSSIRQRFSLEHRDLGSAEIEAVEAATRQWFRLAARHPRAKLSMPSVIVDDYWHEFVLHTRDYSEFCDTGLGRFMHHVPESAMSTAEAAANHGSTLRSTLKLAQEDEGVEATRLPRLFRVDRDLAIAGGRRYLADCGGRGVCYGLKDSVCLQHVDGPGKRAGHGTWSDPPPSAGAPGAGALGGGIGCGAGCGGGG
jgi:hypothetical protein